MNLLATQRTIQNITIYWKCITWKDHWLDLKDHEQNTQHGESNGQDFPQSKDQYQMSNQRRSGPSLSEGFWKGKGKKRKVVPLGFEPRASGFKLPALCHWATIPTYSHPSLFPFITQLWAASTLSGTTFLPFPLPFQRSSDSDSPDHLWLVVLYQSLDCGGNPIHRIPRCYDSARDPSNPTASSCNNKSVAYLDFITCNAKSQVLQITIINNCTGKVFDKCVSRDSNMYTCSAHMKWFMKVFVVCSIV